MKLLNRKPSFCTICKKQISHKHKPKREWAIEGPLCADCYLNKMHEQYEIGIKQKCVVCGVEKKVPDLWEPRWQWEMKGLFCKKCFDEKEQEFHKLQDYCSICGVKFGFLRYNAKSKWKVTGQLCKDCWNTQKAKEG